MPVVVLTAFAEGLAGTVADCEAPAHSVALNDERDERDDIGGTAAGMGDRSFPRDKHA